MNRMWEKDGSEKYACTPELYDFSEMWTSTILANSKGTILNITVEITPDME